MASAVPRLRRTSMGAEGVFRKVRSSASSNSVGALATQRPRTEPTAAAPPHDAPWTLPLTTDPTLLFRVSALTANTHRIHYDHPYATGVEGYPDLVVHGPLLALAMLELPRRHQPRKRVRSLIYRLHSPAFAGEPLGVLGTPSPNGAELTVASARENRHASARVVFA